MVYVDLVMALNFAVDFLLLVGTNALAGHPPAFKRAAASAALGSAYAGLCFLPGFCFLGNGSWRMVALCLMSVIAFGCHGGAFRRGILFVLLSMALGGIAVALWNGNAGSLLFAAATLASLCLLGFRGKAGVRRYHRLELVHRDNHLVLTALCDTGNTLSDPATGRPVIVVDAVVAQQLIGLTVKELADPLQTMTSSPRQGLRLIPYRAVGSGAGMLLGIRPDVVKLDGKVIGAVVAFAPQRFEESEYQALIGGVL